MSTIVTIAAARRREDGRPGHVTVSATFDSTVQADDFCRRFPYSHGLRTSAMPRTSATPSWCNHAGRSHVTIELGSPTGVLRYRRLMRRLGKLDGISVWWQPEGALAYASQADLDADLARAEVLHG